jgi:predicted AlkP superfamily pyrophosphatase or phosphodiesterase
MSAHALGLILGVVLGLSPGAFAHAAHLDARRVVVVSIDGARPDGLLAAATPTITRLWKRGAYSFRAQTVSPSTTLPSHTSMLSGLTPDRHGMWENVWTSGDPAVAVETVFSLAGARGLQSAMVVAKPKLGFLARSGFPQRLEVVPAPATEVAAAAARILRAESPHLLFVHFADPDWAGHEHGWMSRPYFEALARADAGVGILLRALEEQALLAETVLILTADHGGHGRIHGTDLPEDNTIPWIAFGAGIREGYEIPEAVHTTDTAATIVYILDMPIPQGWTGRPLRSVFR